MQIENLEQTKYDAPKFDTTEKLGLFNKSYDSKLKPTDGCYQKFNSNLDDNIAHWLGNDNVNLTNLQKTGAFDIAKQMYSGTEINGKNTLSLKEINSWKINPDYKSQNLKQHAGFSAEVIGTAKENMLAQMEGTGITTYRADDLPDMFPKNDQFVDKVRINAQGEIVDRIQTKFVGGNGEECLSKLASKKFDKYFENGKIDKIEIPKDYYDEIRSNDLIGQKVSSLEKQLARVKAEGKIEAAQNIEAKIERYKKIDQMLERSTVSSEEAIYATKHPKRYTAKLFAKDIISAGHETGKQSGIGAASITATMSTVDNIRKVIEGQENPEQAVANIVKDTGKAGALGYGTGFVSGAVARAMSQSSHELIKSLGNTGVPAAAISLGVQSFDSVVDYAQGTIEGKELAYDLGENTTGLLGSMAGSALAGAALGTVVPGAGNVAGFVAGAVGGMVGCAVTTEAYKTAVEVGGKEIKVLSEKVQKLANETIESVKGYATNKEMAEVEVRASLNRFFEQNDLSFRV